MGLFTNYFADQWLFPAAMIFLLAGAAFALVVGAGLMMRSGTMFRFFATMNRWVSTRKMMKSADQPHDIDVVLHRRTGALGATILVVAGLSLFLLLRNYDVNAIVDLLQKTVSPVLVELAARAAKWLLVAGHLAAIALGIALIFFPAALARFEARINRRYSFRSGSRELDLMHLSLDQWVQSYPRATGFFILALSLFIIVSLGGTLLTRG